MTDLQPGDVVEATALVHALERELPGIVTTEANGDWFVFYDPDAVTQPDSRFPFCTVVTGDRYDAASDLDRDPGSYRVNLGISGESYEQRLGDAPRQAAGREVIDTGVDYTSRDTVMPHPFYAPLHWVCVVNPGERTRRQLCELLDDAYGQARHLYENQRNG
ncbi:MAG: erythromycin esterase [Streptosporangiales bacterium]|nr:erythromycin esterase [Streptosporangiales bacterium]MBO0891268.1 hypothetical protein [Acidothermales bacterium]